MSTAKFNEKGVVIDAGVDLNMESGFSEYIKDLIILTSACQTLALISIYFWNLWLLVGLSNFKYSIIFDFSLNSIEFKLLMELKVH